MADVAALNLQIDSSSVVKAEAALDKFAKASDRAKAAATGPTSSIAKLVATAQSMDSKLLSIANAMDKMAGASRAASAANDNIAKSTGRVGAAMAMADAHVVAYRKRLEAIPPALDRVAKSSGALQTNTGNIAAQFQDISVTAAMGMNPMLIALQQGTQLSAVFAQSGASMGTVLAGAFKQIASPAAIVTIAFVAAAAALIQMVDWTKLAQDALNGLANILPKIAEAAVYLGVVLAIAFAPAILSAVLTLISYIGVGLVNAIVAATQAMIALSLANPYGALVIAIGLVVAAIWAFNDDFSKVMGFNVLGAVKQAANYVIGSFVGAFHDIQFLWNNFPAIIGAAVIGAANATINATRWLIEQAVGGLNALIDGANAALSMLGMGAIGKVSAPAMANIANTYADSLTGAVKDRNSQLQKDLSYDYIGAMGGAIGDAAKWASGKLRGLASSIGAGDSKKKPGADAASTIKPAADEAMRLANWLDKALSGIATRNLNWKDDMPSFLEQEKQAAEAAARVREGQLLNERRLLDVYLQQLDAIGQMGGAFDTIGGIVQGIATGNFRGIGGKLGGILGTIGGMDTGVMAESEYGAAGNKLDKPERIGTTIADHLTKVFRDNGPFFQGFKTLLANAAIGSTAAGLTGGSKLGGALGGALGGKLGKDVLAKPLTDMLGKSLGSLAGPLGSALGGIVGGLVGSAFKKAKYGTATITMDQFGALDSSITSGRGSAQKAAATSAANGVIRSITDITSALGATISGIPNLTVGTYKDSYRVSTTGRTGKLKGKYADVVDFGKDGQEAAIAYAVQLSLERGVITGISQASINILKSGQDLQKAIEKATLIESIPKDLQKLTDPLGYAVNEVNDKFAKIVAALKEGGASAEQMAQAQLLYNLEMADAKASTNSAAQAMKDFLKSLNVGSSSPLSLRSQAETAQAMLDPYLAQINAGQTVNQEKYLAAAQTYLDVQRQIYGSTSKYFEAFDMIQAATSKAIGTAENVTPIRTTSDPFIEQTANATKAMAASAENQNALTAKTNELLQKILAEYGNGGGSSGFIGSARNYA